jgi:regulatory protein
VAIRRTRPDPLDPARAGDFGAAHAAAIALLARRDFPSGELRAKLAEKGYNREVVAEVVEELRERGAVNDERYAGNFVAYHAGRGQGPARIRRDLRGALEPELLEAALDSYADWAALARRVRASKFGASVPADWKSKARQARFLQYRGFSADHIWLALGGSFDESEPFDAAD